MGFLITILITVFSSGTLASNIYTWQDNHGILHFSDKPIKNAKVLELPSTKTQGHSQHLPAKKTKSTLAPAFVRFLTPIHEETIRNNNGDIVIQAISNRALSSPYSYQLYVDNAPYGQQQSENTWQLSNIDRGTHKLKLTLLKDQQVIATSPQITVYLHRARIKKAG